MKRNMCVEFDSYTYEMIAARANGCGQTDMRAALLRGP